MFERKNTCFILSGILVFILFSWNLSFAQPQITGISGTLANGQSITVTGSSFGIKPQAAPWRWDTISNGGLVNGTSVNYYAGLVNGSLIPPTGGSYCQAYGYDCTKDPAYWNANWGKYEIDTNQADQRTTFSTKNLISTTPNNCPTTNTANEKLGVAIPAAWHKLYFSFWFYPYATYTNQNIKFIRILGDYNTSQFAYNNQFFAVDTWWQNPSPLFSENMSALAPNNNWQWSSGTGTYIHPVANEWERIEVYLQHESTPPTSNDGRFIITQTVANSDGTYQRHTYDSGLVDMDRVSNPITNWLTFGQELSNCTEGNTSIDMTTRLSDIYIDNTLARVELCDASTWSAVTHCEIQPPSAWSDSSIIIQSNQGSFHNLNNTYLYIIDANGNISNGYPLCPNCLKPVSAISVK